MHSGELIYHFINTIILTSVVAAWVLWRYRVAVLKGMQAQSGEIVAPAEVCRAENRPAGERAHDVIRWLGQTRRAIVVAVVAALCLPALIMAALHLILADLPRSPTHIWLVASVFASAAVPMLTVFLAIPFWRATAIWLASIGACALTGVALAMIQRLVTGKLPTIDQFMIIPYFLMFAAIEWSVPLMLLLATGARKLRGVAPITLAGLLTFGLAPLLGSRLTAWAASTVAGGAWLLSIGTNAGFFLLALPTGWFAWRRLKAVAQAYESKRLSDAQLLARTWWLMFVASLAITLANLPQHGDKWPIIFAISAVAYLMFPHLLSWTLARLRLERHRPSARTLLLLRVFGYTKRTERLFDGIAARWRFCGPVTMIAAPDVIARTVDPEDFLRYLTGRLSSAFVQSREDLEKRLAELDQRPDPDGRYRINEFCCRDNAWQATVVELMRRADVVIMDLRGVTASRRGCEFELQQLAARLRPEQIVLVVDHSSDRDFIEQAMLGQGAARLPNIVAVNRGAPAETNQLFAKLIAAAYETAQERAAG
jgi:hypothetical protein